MIEQPQSKLRKSRSPSRKQQHHVINTTKESSVSSALAYQQTYQQHQMALHAQKQNRHHSGGVEFRAPLMIEQAEELMLLARQGKTHHMGLRVIETMPQLPRGGTMFLVHTLTFNR